jgi:hypothetical protein
VGPKSDRILGPSRRGTFGHTEGTEARKPCEVGAKDWSYTAASRGAQRTTGKH